MCALSFEDCSTSSARRFSQKAGAETPAPKGHSQEPMERGMPRSTVSFLSEPLATTAALEVFPRTRGTEQPPRHLRTQIVRLADRTLERSASLVEGRSVGRSTLHPCVDGDPLARSLERFRATSLSRKSSPSTTSEIRPRSLAGPSVLKAGSQCEFATVGASGFQGGPLFGSGEYDRTSQTTAPDTQGPSARYPAA